MCRDTNAALAALEENKQAKDNDREEERAPKVITDFWYISKKEEEERLNARVIFKQLGRNGVAVWTDHNNRLNDGEERLVDQGDSKEGAGMGVY